MTGVAHVANGDSMSNAPLSARDLPLGTIAPDAPYNLMLAETIAAAKQGNEPDDARLDALQTAQTELWSELNQRKAAGMQDYARFAATQYGFAVKESGGVDFPWKFTEHHRVGWESHFYTSNPETKTLDPIELDHSRPRVIVFATGRAFAEQNARLGQLATKEALRNARHVMSAQVYLVGSRLVPDYGAGNTQVAAVAYDMVTSDEETPALRNQAILDPSFTHHASMMAAERIFGPMVGEIETHPTGRFIRYDGQLDGKPLPDDEIINNLSKLVLVGGSVGCVVAHQVWHWLDGILAELQVTETVRNEAMRSFLVVNLGPTTVLGNDGRMNRLSVINRMDEFVFAGNDIDPIVTASDETGTPYVPAQGAESSECHVVLDAPATFTNGPDGRVFDPVPTHFGHSMKHYTNGLRDLGLKSLIGKTLDHHGAFALGDLMKSWTSSNTSN